MFKFIRYFIMEWHHYPFYAAFWAARPELYNEIKEKTNDREYKGRFDFAFTNAKSLYKHRDRYSRKCIKAGGDCDICTAKHC